MPRAQHWKTIVVWLIVLLSIAVALPNILPSRVLSGLPEWVPHRQLALGLDLQGGSRLTLKMEREEVVTARLYETTDAVAAALRKAGIGYIGLSGSGQAIELRVRDNDRIDDAMTALKPLTDPVRASGRGDKTFSGVVIGKSDDGLIRVTITDEGIDNWLALYLDQIGPVVSRRLEQIGASGPVVRRQGNDRITVQVPGRYDPQQLKDILSQAGSLSFRTIDMSMPVNDAVNGLPPATSEVLYSADDPPIAYLVFKQPALSNADILDAEAVPASGDTGPSVDIRLTQEGAARFAQATTESAGRTMAVVLDGQVISTPLIRGGVTDGMARISGDFSEEGVSDLALMLRAGQMPTDLTVVEERTIATGLGADSIRAVLTAGAIAALLIAAFMLGFYGFFGAVAVLAVALNVVMIVAVLSWTGLMLTLPGIAGIVLTIGMAVDSNVLIYERVREESRNGRSLAEAIQYGFSRAFAAIVDANITTLIAALILLYLGSGSVRGFAVTLAIGIVTTLFTAFTLTRVMLAAWLRRSRQTQLPSGIRTGIFDGTDFRFMAIRNYVFSLTAALSVAAVLLVGTLGLNLGIDFSGGAIIEVRAQGGNADIEDIRGRLSELNLGAVDVRHLATPQEAQIRVHSQEGGESAEQTSVVLVRDALEDSYDFRRVEVVGPSVSGDLTRAATLGVLVTLVAILLYIWIRFEWQFAIGAIIATLHDVILTIGLFVVTGMEFNLTSIAALLTVVGYSLNDTVVVYDRVRENLKHFPKMPLPILIDVSINQTLSRTVLTGATTMLALAALAIFGGEAIRSFSAALLFGVAVATFSSIYVAGPVLILFRLRQGVISSRQA